MTVSHPPGYDPMPQPPSPADYDACCGSGCDPCIFDLYDQAVARYRKALQEWQGRHPEAGAPETEADVSHREAANGRKNGDSP